MTDGDVENGRRSSNGSRAPVLPPVTLAATLTVCTLSLPIGYCLGYGSPASVDIDRHRNPFHLHGDWQSWIASAICIGGFFGGLLGGVLVDRFGRKFIMVTIVVPFTFGWVTMPASGSAAALFVTRLITGFCSVTLTVAIPTYLSEISPSAVRGSLLAAYSSSLFVGVELSYLCGIWLPWTWLAIVPGAILAVVMPFVALLPESPHWLLNRGRPEAATEALAWFRGRNDVGAELEEIRQKAATSTMDRAPWQHLADKNVYKPLSICTVLWVVQVFSGVDYVMFFTVTIFVRSGIDADPYVQTALVGLATFGGNLVSVWAMDHFGRRPLLLSSIVASAFCMAALGAYHKVLEGHVAFTESHLYWLPLTALVLFEVSYSLGLCSVPAALTAELLPLRARGLGGGIAMVVMNASMFLETRFSLPLTQTWIHDYGVFWSFAVVLLLGAVFVFVFVPETKGKTLESIQEMFQ